MKFSDDSILDSMYTAFFKGYKNNSKASRVKKVSEPDYTSVSVEGSYGVYISALFNPSFYQVKVVIDGDNLGILSYDIPLTSYSFLSRSKFSDTLNLIYDDAVSNNFSVMSQQDLIDFASDLGLVMGAAKSVVAERL